jgi:hypothetical protein
LQARKRIAGVGEWGYVKGLWEYTSRLRVTELYGMEKQSANDSSVKVLLLVTWLLMIWPYSVKTCKPAERPSIGQLRHAVGRDVEIAALELFAE